MLGPREVNQNTQRDLASLAGEETIFGGFAAEKLKRLQAELEPLSRHYDVVVANPPYMGSSSLGKWMGSWVKKHYPEAYRDLCTSFIDRGFGMSADDGYSAMVTMQSWMFLGSFEKLRGKILRNYSISSMAHLGTRAFGAIGGEVVSTTATVFANAKNEVKGAYFRLVYMGSEEEKQAGLLEALANPDCGWFYHRPSLTFADIPGSPIAYWLPLGSEKAFLGRRYSEVFQSAGRTKTHNNELYIRKWWEVNSDLLDIKWRRYCNGGGYSKWAGLDYDVVDWSAEAVNNYRLHGGLPNLNICNDLGLCWGLITSSKTSFRIKPKNYLYSSGSPTLIAFNSEDTINAMAFLNSSLCGAYLEAINPTLNTTVNDVMTLPCPNGDSIISMLSRQCISLVKSDWNSFEVSSAFTKHPLL